LHVVDNKMVLELVGPIQFTEDNGHLLLVEMVAMLVAVVLVIMVVLVEVDHPIHQVVVEDQDILVVILITLLIMQILTLAAVETYLHRQLRPLIGQETK
jgi:hypothetical protein